MVLKIFVVSRGADGRDKSAGIAIEGSEVLFVNDVATVCICLMGLMYALELQKIFLELDAKKNVSSKVYDLNLKLKD